MFFSTLIGKGKLKLLGRARLGRGLKVAGRIRVRVSPGGKLIIGENVRFNSGFDTNPVGSECVNSIWVGPKAALEIQSGAGISSSTIVCHVAVTIGQSTYIGGGTKIYDTDFHSLDHQARVSGKDEQAKTEPVIIGKECFLGGHCIILKGVNIGDQAIVGAGSVVSKDIPPKQMWAGNPAKLIRQL